MPFDENSQNYYIFVRRPPSFSTSKSERVNSMEHSHSHSIRARKFCENVCRRKAKWKRNSSVPSSRAHIPRQTRSWAPPLVVSAAGQNLLQNRTLCSPNRENTRPQHTHELEHGDNKKFFVSLSSLATVRVDGFDGVTLFHACVPWALRVHNNRLSFLYLQGPLISRSYLRANWKLGFHRTGAGWLHRPVSVVHPFRLNFLFLAFTNFPFLDALFLLNRFYIVDRRKWDLFIHTPIGMHIPVDAFSSYLTSATTSFLQLITFFSLFRFSFEDRRHCCIWTRLFFS